MQRLRDRHKARVGLITLPSPAYGLVAHSFHTDNTGVSEFNGTQRLGTVCMATPKGFEKVLEVAREVASRIPRKPLPYLEPWIHALQPYKGSVKGKGKGSGKGILSGSQGMGRYHGPAVLPHRPVQAAVR